MTLIKKPCSSHADVESVARAMKVKVPVVVGVPEIVPAAERVSGGGKAPLVMLHVHVPLQLVAISVVI